LLCETIDELKVTLETSLNLEKDHSFATDF
jgi:hypothetical protein